MFVFKLIGPVGPNLRSIINNKITHLIYVYEIHNAFFRINNYF